MHSGADRKTSGQFPHENRNCEEGKKIETNSLETRGGSSEELEKKEIGKDANIKKQTKAEREIRMKKRNKYREG